MWQMLRMATCSAHHTKTSNSASSRWSGTVGRSTSPNCRAPALRHSGKLGHTWSSLYYDLQGKQAHVLKMCLTVFSSKIWLKSKLSQSCELISLVSVHWENVILTPDTITCRYYTEYNCTTVVTQPSYLQCVENFPFILQEISKEYGHTVRAQRINQGRKGEHPPVWESEEFLQLSDPQVEGNISVIDGDVCLHPKGMCYSIGWQRANPNSHDAPWASQSHPSLLNHTVSKYELSFYLMNFLRHRTQSIYFLLHCCV